MKVATKTQTKQRKATIFLLVFVACLFAVFLFVMILTILGFTGSFVAFLVYMVGKIMQPTST